MKSFKICFIIFFITFNATIIAQSEEGDKKANLSLETQIYPRINTGVIEPNIKWRIMFSDAHVLRSNWIISYQNEKKEILETGGDGVGTVESLQQQYLITLGYEYILKKNWISPYIGFEIMAGLGKNEVYGSRTDTTNTTFISDMNYSSKIPISQFGVGAFSGFDISLVDGFYLGTELGIQYLYTKHSRGEIKIEDASSTTSPMVTTPIPENKSVKFGVSGVGVIRIGWRF